MVVKMVYRAGFINPWHSHSCAHGIYVLEGTLDTHQGQFPAGSFVWFPKAESCSTARRRMRIAPSCSSPTSPLDIHFVGDANDPDAPTM
jgi:ChrR Cupin-like domain